MRQILAFIKDNIIVLAIMTFLVVVLSLSLSVVFDNMFGLSSSMKKEDKAVVANVTPPTPQKVEKTIPTRLIAPSVDLGVAIKNSKINGSTNVWPLSDDTAHYANFTAKLGDTRGTMLIYGHNTKKVMNKTKDLELGDSIYLVDTNGKNWKFRFVDEKQILPTQVEFIYEDIPFRVVMFTCDGWNDKYRRLMFFQPSE